MKMLLALYALPRFTTRLIFPDKLIRDAERGGLFRFSAWLFEVVVLPTSIGLSITDVPYRRLSFPSMAYDRFKPRGCVSGLQGGVAQR